MVTQGKSRWGEKKKKELYASRVSIGNSIFPDGPKSLLKSNGV